MGYGRFPVCFDSYVYEGKEIMAQSYNGIRVSAIYNKWCFIAWLLIMSLIVVIHTTIFIGLNEAENYKNSQEAIHTLIRHNAAIFGINSIWATAIFFITRIIIYIQQRR